MPPINYRENPVSQENKERFESKEASRFFDPCQDAADRSLKCMRRNLGDREMCLDYFQAYKDCKKSWTEDRRKALWSGLKWSDWDSSKAEQSKTTTGGEDGKDEKK